MEENRRRQTKFVSAASHELRAPLSVIWSSLSAIHNAPPEEAIHFIHMAESACVQMSRLIGDTLTLANADNSSWSVHFEDTE